MKSYSTPDSLGVPVELINQFFSYPFLVKALFTAIMVGLVSGVIGSFIILRGLSLMGDAISHAVMPGVAIAFMLGSNFFIGALISGLLAATGIGFIGNNSKLKRDTSIGIVFSAFLALGVLLISQTESSVDLTSILFGNVLAVRDLDMWLTMGIGVLVLVSVFVFFKQLKISTFDPVLASSYGVPTRAIHYGLMIGLTLVTVASIQTVGVILVVALLVTPSATAYLLTNRLSVMVALAGILGMVSATLGLFFSVKYNVASGPMIVLHTAGFFVLAFLFSPIRGVVVQKFRRRQPKVRKKPLL